MSFCPLCNSEKIVFFQADPFLRCANCALIFKQAKEHLPPEEEKHRYSTHENSVENPGYVKFLTPAFDEVRKYVPLPAKGVDYGCGPGPVLATLLQQAGYETIHFDPHFFPVDFATLADLDFVTCTEAAEHFFHPRTEFIKIFSLLKPKGVLVLMTELYQEGALMKDWYYTRDPTHVCFYSETTLQWIANHFLRNLSVCTQRLSVFSARIK